MKAPLMSGLTAAIALALLPKAAIGGDAIDLFVDSRPGNPCQQLTDLQAAIDQAGLEAVDSQKTIHLVRGATFAGRSYRITDLQNLKIVADIINVDDG